MADRRGEGPVVLLVEDEALIALDMEDILTGAGFRIAGVANSVAAALELIACGGMDLALLDVNLNGERVWPAADALRDRNVPFALLTGFGKSLDIPAAHVGAPVLSKPVDRKTLLQTLRDLAGSA